MTVTVPAFDVQGAALQAAVTSIGTLITNNPNDLALGTQLYAAQQALVAYLVATNSVSPASILANETYIGGG